MSSSELVEDYRDFEIRRVYSSGDCFAYRREPRKEISSYNGFNLIEIRKAVDIFLDEEQLKKFKTNTNIEKCDLCLKEQESIRFPRFCSKCNGKIWNNERIEELEKWIKIIREMSNADDRVGKILKIPTVALLDGGSVHRFTLIDKIEKRIEELKNGNE